MRAVRLFRRADGPRIRGLDRISVLQHHFPRERGMAVPRDFGILANPSGDFQRRLGAAAAARRGGCVRVLAQRRSTIGCREGEGAPDLVSPSGCAKCHDPRAPLEAREPLDKGLWLPGEAVGTIGFMPRRHPSSSHLRPILVRDRETAAAGCALPAFKASLLPVCLPVRVAMSRAQSSVARNDAHDTGPLFKPSPKLSALEAAEMQFSALAANDEPREDHGLEVMYYFANAEGTLAAGPSSASVQEALPRYFGCAADLYHFGHFALKFKSRFRRLINHQGFRILQGGAEASSSAPHEGQRSVVRVLVLCSPEGGPSAAQGGQASSSAKEEVWEIGMSVVVRGISAPCWLTDFIRPVEPWEQ